MRVRIAPSNTGPDIHVGNVRTALFNYLIAKQNGGTFVFRIEDSDRVRSKDEYADNILASLNWLGLTPDEGYKCKDMGHGPYMQSQKMDRYKKIADQLIEAGFCYRCFCTQEELNERRQEALAKDPKKPFKYDGRCRDRKDQPKDKPFVIRFKAPTEGEISIQDLVFGKLSFPNKENYDFVIMRSDGSILYNFGCVVDDIDQHITCVIRGRDHLLNTPLQILLYNALNAKIPEWAHLPMLLNLKGEKLAKRDGSASIIDLRKSGFTPGAILNYLAKFGWGSGNDEIFTLDDLLKKFNLNNCKRSDGKVDPKKFEAINAAHLKSQDLLSDSKYVEQLKPFIDALGIGNITPQQLIPFLSIARSRASTFVETAKLLEPMLRTEIPRNKELLAKTIIGDTPNKLNELNSVLQSINDWNENNVKQNIQNWLTDKNILMKDIGGALRLSLLGTPHSPELYQTIYLLGKEKSIKRISDSLNMIKS